MRVSPEIANHPSVVRIVRERNASMTYNCYKCSIAYREAMSRILPSPIVGLVHQMAHQGRVPAYSSDFYWHLKSCMADRPKLAEYVRNFKRPRTE
jgi:hypothetical protein